MSATTIRAMTVLAAALGLSRYPSQLKQRLGVI